MRRVSKERAFDSWNGHIWRMRKEDRFRKNILLSVRMGMSFEEDVGVKEYVDQFAEFCWDRAQSSVFRTADIFPNTGREDGSWKGSHCSSLNSAVTATSSSARIVLIHITPQRLNGLFAIYPINHQTLTPPTPPPPSNSPSQKRASRSASPAQLGDQLAKSNHSATH